MARYTNPTNGALRVAVSLPAPAAGARWEALAVSAADFLLNLEILPFEIDLLGVDLGIGI